MTSWTPQSDGYDDRRQGFQFLDPHQPARIVGATSADDIQQAVRYAAENRLRLAVQAAGHGHARPTDGVLISTRDYAGVSVDVNGRTATVQAGASWAQVIAATTPHGLAPLSGSFPGVGAVSYTLHGGLGVMARKYGFAADNVRRIELVTPDGELRTVTPEQEDLFWALRGGGGNFGVVTELEIELFAVPTLSGGSLYFDLAATPDLLQVWREWTRTVPDEVTSALGLVAMPDIPPVPEPLRGRYVGQLQLAVLTGLPEAQSLIAPLRAAGEPLLDGFGELSYAESDRVFAEAVPPNGFRGDNVLVSDLDPAALAALPKLAGPEAVAMCVAGVRHLGGALARPASPANAVGHRDAGYLVTALTPRLDQPGRDLDEAAALRQEVLAPWAPQTVGRNLNFTYGPIDADEVAKAYEPADHRRLLALRDELDPNGLLQPAHAL